MKNIIAIAAIFLCSNIISGCCRIYDGDKIEVKASKDAKQYRLKQYNTFTKVVYNRIDERWKKQLEEKYHPTCDMLPSVSFRAEECPDDDAIGCYNINPFWCSREILLVEKQTTSCHSKAEVLYHEFLHHFLRCALNKNGHPTEYFYSNWYWEDVKYLKKKLCENGGKDIKEEYDFGATENEELYDGGTKELASCSRL